MKWGVSLDLVGGGRALSAVRLESSCAGPVMASDEVPGQEAVGKCVRLSVANQSKQTPDDSAPYLWL